MLSAGNGHLHDRFFDGISFSSPPFHAVKHLLHSEAESCQFRRCFGGGVAEDALAVCYYDLVSGQRSGCGRVDGSVGQVYASWNMASSVCVGGSGIDYHYSKDLVCDIVVDI